MWKIIPIENRSQAEVYFFSSLDFIFKTYGATYPGVPHRVYKKFSFFIYSARPRSTITV